MFDRETMAVHVIQIPNYLSNEKIFLQSTVQNRNAHLGTIQSITSVSLSLWAVEKSGKGRKGEHSGWLQSICSSNPVVYLFLDWFNSIWYMKQSISPRCCVHLSLTVGLMPLGTRARTFWHMPMTHFFSLAAGSDLRCRDQETVTKMNRAPAISACQYQSLVKETRPHLEQLSARGVPQGLAGPEQWSVPSSGSLGMPAPGNHSWKLDIPSQTYFCAYLLSPPG